MTEKKKLKWNGVDVYETTSDDQGPPPASGMVLAKCSVDADVRGELLKNVLEKAMADGIVVAARALRSALGERVALGDCVRWVKDVRAVKQLGLANVESYRGHLPVIGVTTYFWVTPRDIAGRPGWEIVGRRPPKPYSFREIDKTTARASDEAAVDRVS